jgi:hypothetical protein
MPIGASGNGKMAMDMASALVGVFARLFLYSSLFPTLYILLYSGSFVFGSFVFGSFPNQSKFSQISIRQSLSDHMLDKTATKLP